MSASPQQLYGELFQQVQLQAFWPDSKHFADAEALRLSPAAIGERFEEERQRSGFDLRAFVLQHFRLPTSLPNTPTLRANPPPLNAHLRALWPQLIRQDPPDAGGSCLPLPHSYVVPGGRFRELYYWDSYFTLLGLQQHSEKALMLGMVNNFAHLIDHHGHVPNGSRSYYLSRSQPPLFYRMVALLNPAQPAAAWASYLPQLLREHSFWMQGEAGLAVGTATRRVLRLSDGTRLNRFWDDDCTPRDEAYREDIATAALAPTREPADVYRDLRAAAESGWDFSSRWCADPLLLHSIRTTHIVPVDLNAWLYGLEQAIAQGASHAADTATAAAYAQRASQRLHALQRHWDSMHGQFADLLLPSGQPLPALTAAALVPLAVGAASPAQAQRMADLTIKHLLCAHGLATTQVRSGQQWDAPNGWAPLQWLAVEGLRRYGHGSLAREIAQSWMAQVERVYARTGQMLEKYDLEQPQAGGGGEYPAQQGFGWTNGVYLALKALYPG